MKTALLASILASLISGPSLAQADGESLLLKAAQFDPAREAPQFHADWTAPALNPRDVGVFLVQFDGRIETGDRELLARRGARVVEYMPRNAFVVFAEQRNIARIQREARVRATVRFEPAYKISPVFGVDLKAAAPNDGPVTAMTLAVYEGADTIAATAALRDLGVELIGWDGPGDELMSISTPFGLLDDIAQLELVQWIQPEPKANKRNDTTAWVMQSNKSGSTPIWDKGLFGQDVIIGHIDGAIDTDVCYFDDPGTAIGPNHRKLVSHRGNGSDSHGTHTAGTAAGDQEPISGVTDDAGMAYKARIAHNNLSRVSGSNLQDELDLLYGDGSRIFTNSWGNDFTTDYDAWARDIDKFAWKNQDALPCWAVTNGTNLRNPENAKNCLAVGATSQANNQDSHCTGGRGPTSDGRRKPEIYLPGCSIISARSGRSCSTTSSSGTSMACPAVAGAGALAIEYFSDGWYPSGQANPADAFNPSGALIKATLINGTLDMTGVTGYPSTLEGWGRLKLKRSLVFNDDNRVAYVADVGTPSGFSAPGQTQTHLFDVTHDNQNLEITLAFTDQQASLNANFAPVNDLDLEVIDPNGVVYRGNVFSGGESTTGGSFDDLNNLERVRFDTPVVGMWTVNIHSANVVSNKNQSYALVVNGRIDADSNGTYETYGTGLAGTGGFEPTLQGNGTPNIGASITLEIRDGVGGGFSKTLIGFSRTDVPFAGGRLLVSPPWIYLNASLGGAGGQGGAGTADLAGSLPNDPALVGTAIDFQTLIFDAGAPDGLAMTKGLEMVVGD